MHRFFLPPENIRVTEVRFTEASARQITSVLRLKPDERVIVLDGLGQEYLVCLSFVSVHETLGEVESSRLALGEPSTNLTLLLCLTQREKFEMMLQKCTEVGANCFIPVISARSLVQSAQEVVAKYERWQRILSEAAEQSQRGLVPRLLSPMRLEQAVREPFLKDTCCLIPWEEEKSLSLKVALQNAGTRGTSLLIGPEGGFSAEEVTTAREAGFQAVTLGRRILRMETAAVVASALVLYERGEMDSASDQTA